jgi:pro-kumamolisin-like protein/Big-like domain-containing protein
VRKFSNLSIALAQFMLLIPGLLQAQKSEAVTHKNVHTPLQIANGLARPMGPYNQDQKLRLVFTLKPPKQEEEDAFLEALYKEGSPEYHKFLTAEQFNQRFAPSTADEEAVVDWAISQGLTVTNRYPNRLMVDVEAPVGQIQKALNVNVNRYQLNGATVFSNDRDPVIPPTISDKVMAVIGLNNVQVMHPHSTAAKSAVYPDYAPGPAAALVEEHHVDGDHAKFEAAMAERKKGEVTPAFTKGLLDPIDLYGSNAYNFHGLYNLGHCCNPNHVAAGSPPETSIAIVTVGTQKFSDIQGFHNQFPYLAVNVSYINVDGTPTAPDGEGTLDTEWSTAMSNSFGSFADTSHVYVYQGVNNSHATFLHMFQQVLMDNRTRVMSTSWGCGEFVCATDEIMDSENAVLSQMAAQGWTLVADADDKGSVADCQHQLVEFPASSPNVIAAGGTTLSLNSDSTFNDEVAWTGGTFAGACAENDGGGGGGFSSKFAVPFYQAFLGHGVRTLPDISLNANFPQAIFVDGSVTPAGGTSIVAPELAGFFAQENAYLLFLQTQGLPCFGNQACAPIGNANAYIYSEQMHAPGYAPHYPFYDITAGCASNDITINNSFAIFFCATPGYDFATGLGSANMLQLAWAINYSAAGDFGPPQAQFFGPAVNTWYNTDQTVSMSFSDSTASPRPPTGVAGFSVGWDADPAPESVSKPTPGSNDAFYDGPAFPGQLRGALVLSQAGQGCHTAKAKAWDNTGTSSGVLSYGPICYDTVPPVTTATLSGTLSGGVYTSSVRVTLSATDKGGGVATKLYSLDNGTLTACSAPFSVSAAGTHTVIYFSKDVAGNTENAHAVAFTIKSSPTTTKVTSSAAPSTYGLNVTFTATVTATLGGSATGSVTFKDGPSVLGTAALSSGRAMFTTAALHAGSHAISAVYAGGGNFLASTSPVLTEIVNKAASTTVISSSSNPSVFGKAITFTAAIASSHGGAVSGTAAFKDGTTMLGSGAINTSTRKATFTTSVLSGGSHHITATYSGNADNAMSTSPAFAETVGKSATTTTLLPFNSSTYGQLATFHATVVQASGGSPTGTVTFKDGSVTIGTSLVNTSNRMATFATSLLTGGSHQLTAVYSGSGNDAPSTSAALTKIVNKAGSKVTLASSLNPSNSGQAVTLNAIVVPAFGGSVSGTVTFKNFGTVIGSSSVNSSTGKATFTTSTLRGNETHSITAVYLGNANLNGNTSPAVSQVVK